MSRHMNEWLSAYLDGELHASRTLQVEAHLAECPACRAELESLETLSSLLQEVPAPRFPAPDRFASRVGLRLPPRPASAPRTSLLEIGWWMIPVGLLAAWIFLHTSFFIGDLVSTANMLGLLGSAADWLVAGPSSEAYWTATLGQLGVLSAGGLDTAAATEVIARTSLPKMGLQISIALLYLCWIAIGWARRSPQPQGRLFKR